MKTNFPLRWAALLFGILLLLSSCQLGAPTASVPMTSAPPTARATASPEAAGPTNAFRADSAGPYPGPATATTVASAPTLAPTVPAQPAGPDAAADNPYPRDTIPMTDTEYVVPSLALGEVRQVFKASTALDYPMLLGPDPARQPVFPDVAVEGRPALVAYEAPFEDGDYFQHRIGDIDVPQYYFRVMTAGEVKIPQLGVHCIATDKKGCLVVLINHFGPTTMFRDDIVDNGFTVAGRVWNMDTPDKVTMAGQALIDHYAGRMTASPDGANCATIEACGDVEWHVVVFGNDFAMWHVTGLYRRGVESFNFNNPVPTDAGLTPQPAVHLPAGQRGAQVLEPTKPAATARPAVAAPAPTTAPPVAAPQPTAAAAPAEEAAVETHDLAGGESWDIPAGWSCSGDIKVDGQALYDDNDATALVVHFTVGGKVFAEWGAHCEKSPAAAVAAQITDGRQVVVKEWGGK